MTQATVTLPIAVLKCGSAVSGVPELDGKQEAASGRIVELQVRAFAHWLTVPFVHQDGVLLAIAIQSFSGAPVP